MVTTLVTLISMGFLLLYLGRNEMAGLLRCILPQIEPCRIIGTTGWCMAAWRTNHLRRMQVIRLIEI